MTSTPGKRTMSVPIDPGTFSGPANQIEDHSHQFLSRKPRGIPCGQIVVRERNRADLLRRVSLAEERPQCGFEFEFCQMR
jgi:hypothetical protein